MGASEAAWDVPEPVTKLFEVFAGPSAHVDYPESELRLRAALTTAGVSVIHITTGQGTQFSFEIEAPTVADAQQEITALFRAVYGRDWWADLREAPTPRPA